ncbi:phosphoserine phosphatase SerB [Pseudoglutamicibacter albus]|uniref:phosphoserine phosphatase SerB n=1 Tax=Pseudoglutamicibacter albus TaxID=98671 RepID=UPI000691F870|nr:phosphoserine phosphatase SerB [Pseudoglutamicibacter albus]MCG7305159.1 phosphoserine phosphatase SerB [Pseudoglutamicibacter albus]
MSIPLSASPTVIVVAPQGFLASARRQVADLLGSLIVQEKQAPRTAPDLGAAAWTLASNNAVTVARTRLRDWVVTDGPAQTTDTEAPDRETADTECAWAAWTSEQMAAWNEPAGAIVTDVDSTLIEQEVIEMLAAHIGLEEQVAAVTERAMRGELDFEQSLRERVAVLKGLDAQTIEDVSKKTTPTAGAQLLIETAHARGWKTYAVSGGFQQILDPLAARLNLDGAIANHLEVNDAELTGRVTGPIIDRQAKAKHRAQWTSNNQLPSLGLGDGANDIDLLTTATGGLGLQPKPALKAVADGILSLRRLDAVVALLGWDVAVEQQH